MSELPTDRTALDEYMAVWFRAEGHDTVDLRSVVVRCHTQVHENNQILRRVIDHLENVKDCLTYGWLERLKGNHEEGSSYLKVLNDLVDELCAAVRKKEKDSFVMSELPTDRTALDEYMAVWFHAEGHDTVDLRSVVVRCRTQVHENNQILRRVIDHLENVKDCLTYGWLERLKGNHEEGSSYLKVLNDLVDELCAAVRKKEKDVCEMDY
nr:hypothetical protein [Tanacetum cinerariifolium]